MNMITNKVLKSKKLIRLDFHFIEYFYLSYKKSDLWWLLSLCLTNGDSVLYFSVAMIDDLWLLQQNVGFQLKKYELG